MNNKHLSLNKEINNNFIIASRAYFLHEEAGRRDKELKGSTLGGTTGKSEAEGRHIRYEL